MDVILQQVEPRQLQLHCHNAMATQVTAVHVALKEAVRASHRVEEVHTASQKLEIAPFDHNPELFHTLARAVRLRDKLSQSLDRLLALASEGREGGGRGERGRPAVRSAKRPLPMAKDAKDPESDQVSDADEYYSDVTLEAPREDERKTVASDKKRRKTEQQTEHANTSRRSVSSSREPSQESASAASQQDQEHDAKTAAAITKSLAACFDLAHEQIPKMRLEERATRLKTLVLLFNTVQKDLNYNTLVDQVEAIDVLELVVSTAVEIMVKAKPEMQRHWVVKFRTSIVNLQAKFPEHSAGFDASANALSKIISDFPLTVKEGKKLRGHLRRALEEVKAWEEGKFTITDGKQKMKLITETLECTFPNWNPYTDKTLRQLVEVLQIRMSYFKNSKKQAKRMQKLQSWLVLLEMDESKTPTRMPTTKAESSGNKRPDLPAKSTDKLNRHKKSIKSVSKAAEVPRQCSPHLAHRKKTTADVATDSSSATDSEPRIKVEAPQF